jgi:hypothetical protein
MSQSLYVNQNFLLKTEISFLGSWIYFSFARQIFIAKREIDENQTICAKKFPVFCDDLITKSILCTIRRYKLEKSHFHQWQKQFTIPNFRRRQPRM